MTFIRVFTSKAFYVMYAALYLLKWPDNVVSNLEILHQIYTVLAAFQWR